MEVKEPYTGSSSENRGGGGGGGGEGGANSEQGVTVRQYGISERAPSYRMALFL